MDIEDLFIKDKIDLLNRENHLIDDIPGQKFIVISEFTLQSGVILKDVPVAYMTWGELNEEKSNVILVCHIFSSSADVSDWWGPLLGAGRALDSSKFFIICFNVLGSPYGTASPLTVNLETGEPYGPDFPITTIRDDVYLHRKVLDLLKINTIALVVGGSLGGMHALEWAMLGSNTVRNIISISSSGRHSAWGISCGEVQRQIIYLDHRYNGGHYAKDCSPEVGLCVARMSAFLTYRSHDSFVSKFGRRSNSVCGTKSRISFELTSRDGFQSCNYSSEDGYDSDSTLDTFIIGKKDILASIGYHSGVAIGSSRKIDGSGSMVFSAQSYLRHQGEKFAKNFDANCYICISKKMDTHDIAHLRNSSHEKCLNSIEQPTMIVGIESDALFTICEQEELATHIPNASFYKIDSYDGHSGFLIEFDQLNLMIGEFIKNNLSEFTSTTN
ncbi:Homoserine O-acetyltransferase [Smittium mucronatum]|uniref:Homoserine O-acetyltransferase n=1 Tax=Smittium mucronatum TaxID=133383 RepID=A0A1R0H9K1_9FUNG|nr:Homoserine O-acetyltransferase [Smittium mucronatum]